MRRFINEKLFYQIGFGLLTIGILVTFSEIFKVEIFNSNYDIIVLFIVTAGDWLGWIFYKLKKVKKYNESSTNWRVSSI
ncbi:hypothetical protein V7056_18055 [Bacillus sp. JJ664]